MTEHRIDEVSSTSRTITSVRDSHQMALFAETTNKCQYAGVTGRVGWETEHEVVSDRPPALSGHWHSVKWCLRIEAKPLHVDMRHTYGYNIPQTCSSGSTRSADLGARMFCPYRGAQHLEHHVLYVRSNIADYHLVERPRADLLHPPLGKTMVYLESCIDASERKHGQTISAP